MKTLLKQHTPVFFQNSQLEERIKYLNKDASNAWQLYIFSYLSMLISNTMIRERIVGHPSIKKIGKDILNDNKPY